MGGGKVLFLSSLSLSLDKQAKCYPVSISIETRGGGGGLDRVEFTANL